eukprot:8576034-Pyramimonas_sp.AAC.1
MAGWAFARDPGTRASTRQITQLQANWPNRFTHQHAQAPRGTRGEMANQAMSVMVRGQTGPAPRTDHSGPPMLWPMRPAAGELWPRGP